MISKKAGGSFVRTLTETEKEIDDEVSILEKEFKDADIRDTNPNVPVMGKKYSCDFSSKKQHYFQKWNEMLGFPFSHPLGKPNPMAPFQLQYHDLIHQLYWLAFNKSRKIGATDTRVRGIALDVFGFYSGHDVAIVAGNKESIANEILFRYDELFENGFTDLDGKKWKYGDIVMKFTKSSPAMIEHYNGTRVGAFPASKSGKANPMRGLDDLISINLIEAAHTGMIDDHPLNDALQPNLAQRANAHLVYESTPNGKRGIFFEACDDAMVAQKHKTKSSFHYFEVDYREGLKYNILSKEFIEKQKADPRVDFDQEYCCKFTTSRNAVFQELSEDNYLQPDEEVIDLTTMLE